MVLYRTLYIPTVLYITIYHTSYPIGILYFSPMYPEEEMDEENIIDDDTELTLNKVEDEVMMVKFIA